MEDNVEPVEEKEVDTPIEEAPEEPTQEEPIDTTTQLGKLKIKIPYDENIFTTQAVYEGTLNSLLEDSKNIALANIYPFQDWSEYELPTKYNNWQIRAALELYNFDKFNGITSYSENGLSFNRSSDGLSKSLLDELMPMVGVPKKIQKVDETTQESKGTETNA